MRTSAYESVYWCGAASNAHAHTTATWPTATTETEDSDDMDHETLYTASKWDILKRLEHGPSSPLELSKFCRTSIANVSQQLRLLEMAGLVTSVKVSNRDKGKPRVLYSIAGDMSYLIATAGDFVEKKALQLNEFNKIVMRIWFYDVPALRYTLEKAFWRIEEHLPKLSFIGIDTTREKPVTLCVAFTGKPSLLQPFTITDSLGVTRQVVFTTSIPKQGVYTLHDHRGSSPTKKRGDRNE